MKIIFFLYPFLFPNESFSKVIAITKVSNINFGVGVPGDSAKVISPGTVENSENGSFRVTGDANRAFTIILPTSVSMKTGTTGAANTLINVTNFNSFPAAGANGVLDSAGKKNIFIGATRSSLLSNQKAGSYSGTFSVTVVY